MPTPRKPQQRKAAFKAQESPTRMESDRRIPLIVLAVIAAIMLIVLVFTQCSKSEPSDVPAPGEPATSEQEAVPAADVEPPENPSAKASLNDYSWEEISQISAKIADAGTADEAIYVAKQYNLVDADGKLDQHAIKAVSLTDGSTANVRIIGFNADTKSDGSGPAGITFMFTAPVTTAAYNDSGTIDGGWGASDLSYYLGVEFWSLLPEDLITQISEVSKHTVMGEEASDTGDIMWLPSYSEVLGNAPGNLGEEGAQYQLFRDDSASAAPAEGEEGEEAEAADQPEEGAEEGTEDKVNQHIPPQVISNGGEAGTWWLRSIDSSAENKAYGIDATGNAATYAVDSQNMVVPCFSI